MAAQVDAMDWYVVAYDALCKSQFEQPALDDESTVGEKSCWIKEEESDSTENDGQPTTYNPLAFFQKGNQGFHVLPANEVLTNAQFGDCCLCLFDSVSSRSSHCITVFPMDNMKVAMQKAAKQAGQTGDLFSCLSAKLGRLETIEKSQQYSESMNTPVLLCVGARNAAERILDVHRCSLANEDLHSMLQHTNKQPFQRERVLTVRSQFGDEQYDDEHIWALLKRTAGDLRKALSLSCGKSNVHALGELSKVLWTRLHDYHQLVLLLNLERDQQDEKWPTTVRDFIPEQILCFFDTLARITAMIASIAGLQDSSSALFEAITPKYRKALKEKESIFKAWSRQPKQRPTNDGLGPVSLKQMHSGRYRPYEFPKNWVKSLV